MSSLISNNFVNSISNSYVIHSICYKMHCSNKSLTLEINNNYIVCPRTGGKISVLNFQGFLFCPDYYLICSGTVICNDMFDCIKSKYLLKENINYEYNIQTTQDINYNEDNSGQAYELDTYGKCPQFCSQCDESFQCIKCADNYKFVKNELNKIICKSITELSNGYYLSGVIYNKCIENCDECSNDSSCETCSAVFFENNGKCILIIEKYENYDNNGKYSSCSTPYKITSDRKWKHPQENCDNFNDLSYSCMYCKDGHILKNGFCYTIIPNWDQYIDDGLFGNCISDMLLKKNKTACFLICDLNEYYTKDNGIKYYKCDEGDNEIDEIENCKNCEYNNANDYKLICKMCQSQYILKDDDTNKCYPLSEYSVYINNQKFYYKEENHIQNCSFVINNCDKCGIENLNQSIICKKCKTYFKLSNNACIEIVPNCLEYENEFDD